MKEKEIFNLIIKILKNQFHIKNKLTPQSNLKKLKNWDSLKHLDFIMSCEKEFFVSFTINENYKIQTIDQFIKKILIKLKNE